MKKLLTTAVLSVLCIMLSACNQETVQEETVLETVAATQAQTEPAVMPTEPPTEPPTEAPTEPTAEQITEGYRILIDGFDNSPSVLDHNHYSKITVKDDQVLSVESATAFSNIYIEWDVIPGLYELVWDGGRISCGENGFFHEFIRLPQPVTQVRFAFPDASKHVICQVDLFTAGSAPEGVQVWLPPCEEADILVFPTHSDDDVLFFGPLMAYYAIEKEYKIQTAFMVEHHGYPERNHERLNGLWEMGIRHYPILGTAPDTPTYDITAAMTHYASSNIDQWQVEQIRRCKPFVVVGHDFEGEYGNGGHKVNAYYLAQTVESAADPAVFPESAAQYGVWETPKFYVHLYAENEIILDVNTPLAKDAAGRTPFEIAVDAFKCHVSQHPTGFRVRQEGYRGYDCRPFGLYRSLVGKDTTTDIMENIDPLQWRTGT